MQLLKSLFCIQGFDNRQRFFLIQTIIYLLFLLSSPLSSTSIVTAILLMLTLSTLQLLSCLRRMQDAKMPKKNIIGCSASYLITSIIMLVYGTDANWLLLITIAFAIVLFIPMSNPKRDYILGYAGPIDLSEFNQTNIKQQRHAQRVEPQLCSVNDIQNITEQLQQNHQTAEMPPTVTFPPSNTQESTINLLTQFQKYKKHIVALVILGGFLSIMIISMTFTPITEGNRQAAQLEKIEPLERLLPLTFPDSFTLMLSQYSGLIIHWQADVQSNGELWSLNKAQGENSCQQITFNKDKKVRTTHVSVENNSHYFAYFSPLDSKTLLTAIARQNSFQLCGYPFSLNGSQSILAKHTSYADIMYE